MAKKRARAMSPPPTTTTTTTTTTHLPRLPDEIWERVIAHLDFVSVCALRQCDRRMRSSLTDGEDVWERLCARHGFWRSVDATKRWAKLVTEKKRSGKDRIRAGTGAFFSDTYAWRGWRAFFIECVGKLRGIATRERERGLLLADGKREETRAAREALLRELVAITERDERLKRERSVASGEDELKRLEHERLENGIYAGVYSKRLKAAQKREEEAIAAFEKLVDQPLLRDGLINLRWTDKMDFNDHVMKHSVARLRVKNAGATEVRWTEGDGGLKSESTR
jgi:hypothetical protein